jgi:hypothetical protein
MRGYTSIDCDKRVIENGKKGRCFEFRVSRMATAAPFLLLAKNDEPWNPRKLQRKPDSSIGVIRRKICGRRPVGDHRQAALRMRWRLAPLLTRSFFTSAQLLKAQPTVYEAKLAARKPPPVLLETDIEENFIKGTWNYSPAKIRFRSWRPKDK